MGSVYLDGERVLNEVRRFVKRNEPSEAMRGFLLELFRLADLELDTYDDEDAPVDLPFDLDEEQI